MKRFLIWLTVIAIGLLVAAWIDGLNTAIRQGDIASLRDYLRLQSYRLKSGNGVALATVELRVEPQRIQYLLDSIRKYAAERNLLVASSPRSKNNPIVVVSVWGGSAFNITLINLSGDDGFTVSFFEFDEKEDWRPYRDDFLAFLRTSFGTENLHERA